MTHSLSQRELAHILAALRATQERPSLLDGMPHFDDIEEGPLESDEIDELCERIICEDTRTLNEPLLLNAVRAAGSYSPDEVLPYIEESLTVSEASDIREFLGWVHKHGRGFGHGNIGAVWREFLEQR